MNENNIIKTLKGTVIKRYKNLVGKQVGPQVYVHKKYAAEVIPHDILKNAVEKLKEINPSFKLNSIMWDSKSNVVRFDEAPDFDTAREPHVGKYISIFPDGNIKENQSNSIWHHKWLWVKDDYTGFNVEESKKWSILWLSKLDTIAKGTDSSFNAQLQQVGLKEGRIKLKSLI